VLHNTLVPACLTPSVVRDPHPTPTIAASAAPLVRPSFQSSPSSDKGGDIAPVYTDYLHSRGYDPLGDPAEYDPIADGRLTSTEHQQKVSWKDMNWKKYVESVAADHSHQSLTRIKQNREAWFAATVPTHVQTLLNQPFGKENIHQCFTSDVRFCHILVFLLQSGHLDDAATAALLEASRRAYDLDQLIRARQSRLSPSSGAKPGLGERDRHQSGP